MILEPERAAALMAERLRRPLVIPAGVSPAATGGAGGQSASGAAPAGGAALEARRDWLVQRTLEELGIHCESASTLQDLKGFLIASPRGADIVVSDRLGPDERLAVYAHLLAHALLEELPGDEQRNFFSRLEYVEGRRPDLDSGAERRQEMVADALAQAILRGRLDGTPQYAYRRTKGPAKSGLRPFFGQLFLDICHRASLALFWHSPKYQKLRSRDEMAFLVRRLEDLVRVAYAC